MADDPNPPTTERPRPKRRPGSEIRAKIEEAGGALRLVDSLLSRIEGLEADLETAKTKSQLPAGAVVLKGDDAKAWEQYQALGTVDDVKAAVAERDTLKQRDAARTRADAIRAKAEEAGLNARVVERLSRDPEAGFEVDRVEEVERDGKKVKALFVKRAGVENAQAVELDAYAREHFAEFADTLRAAPNGTNGTTPPQRPAGPAYPAQPVTPANGGGAVSEEQLRNQKAQSGAYAL